MSLDASALLKHAAKAELRESEKILFGHQVFSTLDSLLLDIHAMLQPRPIDYEQRRLLIEEFNSMAVDRFGNNGGFPTVEAFGSFVMDLFTSSSDLDLSVNFSNNMNNFPRKEKISVLGKLSKVLYGHQRKGHVTGVLPIMGARVPVLKVVDCRTGVECDISVENKDGISRSLIFRFVSSIDERFRILCYLMKAWAKAHDINSSKDRTMNSLSIIALVAFHLQTRNPPILPPFCALLKDGTDMLSIERRVAGFKNFGIRNRESVAELFVSLLRKLLSVMHLWGHGLCASTCEGSWICKKQWASGVGNMNVEDFLDRSENFARSVGEAGMQKIYECIRGSLSDLSRFAMRQIDSLELKELIFKSVDDLNAPKKEGVHNEVVQHKRRYPFHDAGTSVKPMTSKRPRYLEPTRAPDHARYQTPNPLAALQSQATSYGIYRPGLIFGSPQPAFTPYHHHRQRPVASLGAGYGSPPLQQNPFASQRGYGSYHQPVLPGPPYIRHSQQRDQQDQDYLFPGRGSSK
uniref:Poly(A) RNA polymerase mitochondrial-like central palm domain-containing protein n=3 Tax=Musa acuminata subsp. malaccensis TaxID=214687 RepID=A0A804JX24_MUSAM|nr:PREDICTED: protein HESO1 isoform X2 [Musa acuminata subsp. malaccensis]XP_009386400.1 PREDICTED: protein HESO1 isoform X2 [Musa acuminata subsp. malaccensis]XP_009386401.1 PREDICTED: protein HESO1 isoform X2 [Musa acuminata subsp. malaccensis]XP_018677019.1 PREDICTED: protein HESO1 isoform X2 [Musa acuminata subsp. malaccensis]XP_018677020.1 PREDICTED: protein HESO1 isoform X2 [Musa acuminata subsp. malaccensis]